MNKPLVLKSGRSASRKIIGWLIVVFGTLYALQQFVLLLQQQAHVRYAFYAGMVAATATALGALPVLFSRRLSARFNAAMLGFGGGVMLAASIFSLILPAMYLFTGLSGADSSTTNNLAYIGSLQVAVAILLGAAAMMLLERVIPHEHFIKGAEGQQAKALKRSWLFVLAIMLHNIPEGLAIGAAYAGGEATGASALATGIAIQDIPEGFVVAMALLAVGYRRRTALAVGMLSGLTEPLMAVLGATVLGASPLLLPWGLALAAGAMLFVISHEMIPESHRQGHELAATNGLMLGFVLMLILDTALV
ncbi:ZIP family metal transporter [Alishewanella longhuensis]|uniref:ZIP family metal transporter n=1 Tax=Alishewanella longhuensis TaxID=1091037 RepID=A0ABQ3L151_9ALTE|nr:ZIP family metal transporter [Alishewanella longhuensis]GHG72653.1 ZIP family metal transporter [Alishewanella longhuensis]